MAVSVKTLCPAKRSRTLRRSSILRQGDHDHRQIHCDELQWDCCDHLCESCDHGRVCRKHEPRHQDQNAPTCRGLHVPELVGQVLNPGDFISTLASTAGRSICESAVVSPDVRLPDDVAGDQGPHVDVQDTQCSRRSPRDSSNKSPTLSCSTVGRLCRSVTSSTCSWCPRSEGAGASGLRSGNIRSDGSTTRLHHREDHQ